MYDTFPYQVGNGEMVKKDGDINPSHPSLVFLRAYQICIFREVIQGEEDSIFLRAVMLKYYVTVV